MSPEVHQRVRTLFDQAMERPEAERLAFLEDQCRNDPEVYREVVRLIKANADAQEFLETRPTHRSERIDRYFVKGELGRGAMGVVYEAVDPLIGRTVAIKVISLEATSPKEQEFMRDSLFREARSAGSLNHPGIVTIFDVGQENDTAFITMERVEGPTLQGIIDSGGIPDVYAILDILRQAAAALDSAHQSGVVHRDIKPANIMLHKGTMVKVADFGIAKVASAHTKTLTGMVMGTPAYMSPEQIETKPLDGRSDQFSLVVVAYELLTGQKPFTGELLGPLMHSILYGPRPSACAANPNLPPAIDAVFERGMRKAPEERFANCSEFVGALESCFPPRIPTGNTLRPPTGQYPITPPPPRPPSGVFGPGTFPGAVPPPPPGPLPVPVPVKRGTNPLPAILAACGVLVLGAGGFFGYRYLMPHGEPGKDPGKKVVKTPMKLSDAPSIGNFTVSPATVEPGGTATLRWDVSNATDVSIDQGVGAVATSGERSVLPLASMTFTLTAKGPAGNASARAAVEVTALKPPPKDLPTTPAPTVSNFRTDPTTVRRGERFRLDWSVKGVSQVSIDHGIGAVDAKGSRSVVADSTTTYTLTAKNDGGTATSATTITVNAEPVKTASQLYDEGMAAKRDKQWPQAIASFQQAANKGEARAMLELGLIYHDGNGVPKDPAQSVSWLEKAANAGNSSGMDYMGAMYLTGEGVPKDDRQAFGWYSKAAAAGNPIGMDALGQMYRNGRGVAKSYPDAVNWFNKSAAAGNPSGTYHLGQMYENGWGVARNPGEAMTYYRKAAAAGDREAARRVAEMPNQPSQASSGQKTVRVAANVPWSDTGVDLRQGDQVTISASGSVRVATGGELGPVSPAGVMSNCSGAASMYGRPAGTFPAPNLPCWSLLGRVAGPAPAVFEIGMNRTFTASSAGRLYLGVNDDNVSDNSGAWNVVISVNSNR